MSVDALKSAATSGNTTKSSTTTLVQLLAKDTFKAQIACALPKHITADRMVRIATTEIRKIPKLATCDQRSFLGAIMQCAQLGLEPGGALGHSYLIPFENKKNHLTEVQLIIGYRGMLDIARRSGQIVSISARIVHERDHFRYAYGLREDIEHVPCEDGDQGRLTHVYAVARLKDGGVQFEVMSKADIDKVRAQSKSSSAGPWVTHYDEMAKKTVIRRLFKYLPVSIEMQTAVSLDEKAETDISQDNGFIIDSDYTVDQTEITETES